MTKVNAADSRPLRVVILANAVLHPVAARPLLERVQAIARTLEPSSVRVVGGPQNGPLFEEQAATILVLRGDVPLLTTATLRRLLNQHHAEQAAATVLASTPDS